MVADPALRRRGVLVASGGIGAGLCLLTARWPTSRQRNLLFDWQNLLVSGRAMATLRNSEPGAWVLGG